MFRTTKIACAALGLSVLTGCYRGYKSAKELDSDERGPKACEQACKDLGLQMSAFVLVERQTSGCVCSPAANPAPASASASAPQAPPSPAPAPTLAPAAAAAAVQVVDEQKKRAAEQQRTEQPTSA